MDNTDLRNSTRIRVDNALTTITKVFSILTYLGVPSTLLVSFFSKSLMWAVFAVILLLVYISLRFVRKFQYVILAYFMNLFGPDLPYRVEEKRSIYEYKNMKEMTYSTICRIKPLSYGVNCYHIRSAWSGETDKNTYSPVMIVEDDYVTGEIINKGEEFGFKMYEVKLEQPRSKKDDDFLVGYQYPSLKDENQRASTYLSSTVTVVTKKLHLEVILPNKKKCYPEDICFVEYLHAADDFHWRCTEKIQPKKKNKKWVIEWNIENPIFGSRYVIRWKFNKSGQKTHVEQN